jgi:hypothetical protein
MCTTENITIQRAGHCASAVAESKMTGRCTLLLAHVCKNCQVLHEALGMEGVFKVHLGC